MTNEQIIASIAITVYGEDAVTNMIDKGEDIPLHTIKGWAKRGHYRVKKGEHGIETRLWKRKRKDTEESDDDKINIDDASNKDFYMAKAFLFRKDQVERVEE